VKKERSTTPIEAIGVVEAKKECSHYANNVQYTNKLKKSAPIPTVGAHNIIFPKLIGA
jgi:hypothetical protein